MKKTSLKIIFVFATLTLFAACDPYYNGGYNSGGYNNGGYNSPPPYYGGSNYDNDYYSRREAERARNERYQLERERDRLEEERRRNEYERNRQPTYRPPPPQQRQPDCPSGFYKGSKCSNEERKRGCRDLRGPNGDSCRSM